MKTYLSYSNQAGRGFGARHTMNPNPESFRGWRSHCRRLARILPGLLLGLTVLPPAALGQSDYATPYTFTTIAGKSFSGCADGTNGYAQFAFPFGMAVDSTGNVYVADAANCTIRELTPVGTNWVVTTLAGLAGCSGTNDGAGSAARFSYPAGVAVDTSGNLYVADTANHTIREVTPFGTNWVVTTLVGQAGRAGTNDGTGSAAHFNGPGGVAVDSAGIVYVADTGSHTIRKVTPVGANWEAMTLAGLGGSPGSATGWGNVARFYFPQAVAVDSADNVYVADSYNNTIRKVMPVGTNWLVTTLAGVAGTQGSSDGTGSGALFHFPLGVTVDTNDNVFVADSGNNTIRKLTPTGSYWTVTTLAGLAGSWGYRNGTASAARFVFPLGVTVDSAGNLFVTDNENFTIRKITLVGTNWVVTTLAGVVGDFGAIDGTGVAARFLNIYILKLDGAGNLYLVDTFNNTIRKGFPASSVPAPLLQPPSLSAGQFGFGITGVPNLPVNIEASADLANWQVVGTGCLGGGTNSFVSPNPASGAQFYRAQVR